MVPHLEPIDQVSEPRSIRELFLEAAGNLRGRLGIAVELALAFDLLRFFILAPISAGMLGVFLERWGRGSVGNFEILAFLLSPPGLTLLALSGVFAVTTLYFEFAGITLILAHPNSTLRGTVPALGEAFVRLLALGARQFAILTALAAPFLAAIAGTLILLWAGYDLNGLIVLKPPVFWVGAGLCVLFSGTYAVIGGYLLIRWAFSLPIVLFERDIAVAAAMRLSRQRMRGRWILLLRLVLIWLATVVLLSLLAMGGLRFGSAWLLDHLHHASLRVVLPVTAVLLILHALAATLMSVVGRTALASLLLALYRNTVGTSLPPQPPQAREPSVRARLPSGRAIGSVFVALVASLGLVSYLLLARVQLHEGLEITAHRGGAALAPENTVAAVRRAIEVGADWAEIDVQRTADGAIVVLHDSDLVRVGGSRQHVSESTLSQIKSVHVAGAFGEEFRGERVPTLDEVIAAAGTRIRLNIELKPNGPGDVGPLASAVLDSVKRAGILDRCRLCSQSNESLELARQQEPGIQVGFIAGAKIGDLSRLDVNFLMVARRLATRKLAEAARSRGMEVHVWTINDPDELLSLLDQGVANIITDDPAALRHRLNEVQELSLAERLLLKARNLLVE